MRHFGGEYLPNINTLPRWILSSPVTVIGFHFFLVVVHPRGQIDGPVDGGLALISIFGDMVFFFCTQVPAAVSGR